MRYKVYHANPMKSMFDKTPETFNPEGYDMVAEVECIDEEDVFRATNHIDSDWTKNPEVISVTGRCRSTSVGDVVVDEDGVALYCAGCGWEDLGKVGVEA